MTLEEHIAAEKQRADSLIISASKLKPEELVVRKVYERGVEEHREKAELLEELKTLRKAYDLIAGDWANTYLDEEKQDIKDYYLQKARENNDNS